MKPEFMEVIDSSNYEFILFKSDHGRLFLYVTHESGFGSYSQVFELNAFEIDQIKSNKIDYIKDLRGTFNHSTKSFDAIETNRFIDDFWSWESVKQAKDKWHKSAQNT